MKRVALLVTGVIAAWGQAQIQFDVASIRASKDNAVVPSVRITPGRVSVENLTPHRLIVIAYKIRDFQLSGGPGWINSERYDIEAKTDGANGADAMLWMLQALLEDRFELRVHHEMRKGAVYDLTIAKSGNKMQPARCVPFDPNNLPKQSSLSPEERSRQCGGIRRSAGELDGNGMSLEDGAGPAFQSLAGQLSLILGRPVLNRTGKTGRFDVQLRWSADEATAQNDPGNPATADPAGPSLFTAIQEQLGLRLEPGKGPVDNLVLEHIARPRGN